LEAELTFQTWRTNTAQAGAANTVAGLETANKHLGRGICGSDAVAKGVARFCGRPIGELMLRGRSKPLYAFEPLSDSAFEMLKAGRRTHPQEFNEAGRQSWKRRIMRSLRYRPMNTCSCRRLAQ